MNFDIFNDSPKFPKALCAKLEDKDYFFPDTKHNEAERLPQLKQICGSCTHRKECLEFALDKQIVYGFWGGYSAEQRGNMTHPNPRIVISKKALKIQQMLWENKSANEIAITVQCSSQYVYRLSAKLEKAAREGAIQSNPQTNKSLSDSPLLWWLA